MGIKWCICYTLYFTIKGGSSNKDKQAKIAKRLWVFQSSKVITSKFMIPSFYYKDKCTKCELYTWLMLEVFCRRYLNYTDIHSYYPPQFLKRGTEKLGIRKFFKSYTLSVAASDQNRSKLAMCSCCRMKTSSLNEWRFQECLLSGEALGAASKSFSGSQQCKGISAECLC